MQAGEGAREEEERASERERDRKIGIEGEREKEVEREGDSAFTWNVCYVTKVIGLCWLQTMNYIVAS